MNKRINFGKNTPLSFRENLQFDQDCPYKIRCKDFANDDIAPLHYAAAMEIAICCGITGEFVIENEHIVIDHNTVVVIPPKTVHSVSIRQGPGQLYVLHISFEALRSFVDAEALLREGGIALADFPRVCPEFQKIHQLVQEMIRLDDHPLARTCRLLEVLELLSAQVPVNIQAANPVGTNKDLRRILRWTEENFTGDVELVQAAAAVGFSKNYFCAWFKSNTGTTYRRYLNNVRINNACRLLVQTGSISTACYESGFRDMSYFIQLFKKTQGCTPKVYLNNMKK